MATGKKPFIKKALFQCMTCGKKYFTTGAAEKVITTGCTKCGDFNNIDLFVEGEYFFNTRPQKISRGVGKRVC